MAKLSPHTYAHGFVRQTFFSLALWVIILQIHTIGAHNSKNYTLGKREYRKMAAMLVFIVVVFIYSYIYCTQRIMGSYFITSIAGIKELQSWKEIVGTPDTVYYNYPHAYH